MRLDPLKRILCPAGPSFRTSPLMAMTFEVGGKKVGFGRETFLKAFRESGMDDAVSAKLISRMCSCRGNWENLISASFLRDAMKDEFRVLLDSRLALLQEF